VRATQGMTETSEAVLRDKSLLFAMDSLLSGQVSFRYVPVYTEIFATSLTQYARFCDSVKC